MQKSVSSDLEAKLRSLILDRQSDATLWGVKEWRLALSLSLFVGIAGDVRIIRTIRDHTRSAESWNRHFNRLQTVDTSAIRRASHLIDNAITQVQRPTMEVDFDTLIDRPDEQIQRICDFAGVPVPANAGALVDPSLRRF